MDEADRYDKMANFINHPYVQSAIEAASKKTADHVLRRIFRLESPDALHDVRADMDWARTHRAKETLEKLVQGVGDLEDQMANREEVDRERWDQVQKWHKEDVDARKALYEKLDKITARSFANLWAIIIAGIGVIGAILAVAK